jgi:hypothetical protein
MAVFFLTGSVRRSRCFAVVTVMWNPWKNQLVTRSNCNSNRTPRRSLRRILRTENLEKRNLLAGNIFHNDSIPEDVNDDGRVSSMDALAIVNRLNQGGSRDLRSGDSGPSRLISSGSVIIVPMSEVISKHRFPDRRDLQHCQLQPLHCNRSQWQVPKTGEYRSEDGV